MQFVSSPVDNCVLVTECAHLIAGPEHCGVGSTHPSYFGCFGNEYEVKTSTSIKIVMDLALHPHSIIFFFKEKKCLYEGIVLANSVVLQV